MRLRMFATALVGASLAAFGCGGGGPTGGGGGNGGGNGNGNGGGNGSASVVMYDNFFDPGVATIQVGTTVTWNNQGNDTHTSTSDTGLWDSGNVTPGNSTSFEFNEPGEFEYHCENHVGMNGTIIVEN